MITPPPGPSAYHRAEFWICYPAGLLFLHFVSLVLQPPPDRTANPDPFT